MKTGQRPLRGFAAASLVAVTFAGLASGATQATPSPGQLYRALLKPPPPSSLPPALRGSTIHADKLSPGSRLRGAVGAVEIGNGQAIVGFLVFATHGLVLADLSAYPPNRGPNKIVRANPVGFPRPAYILHAVGNGYEAAYLVFVLNNVLVNAWTYGRKGTERTLIAVVQRDARWAKSFSLRAMRSAK